MAVPRQRLRYARLKQAVWFVGLWLAGVAVLAVVAGLIRWWLSPG